VFVRFLEDNRLTPTALLSGPGERRQRALDEHELYFKNEDRRTHSDRDYLLHVFEQVRGMPAAAELFDPKHNPLWAVGPTGDGATELLRFWQRVDPDTGALIHDFTDPDWNTRFLGDLYQDLSESARKKYALLQTPEFVEEFILDRTLMPAIGEFGFQQVRLIDPTCGSGHFLLGAFHRLFELWVAHEPVTNPRALAQRALDQVFGVDLNPYAVANARFRLLIAALKASDVHSIRREEAPAFHVNVAAGDSLLHGRRFDQLDLGSGADQLAGRAGIGHAFFAEDLEALDRILGQQYQAVVGNPPYITVKDKALNQLYRERYRTCHRQYSLAVPFTERFCQLALSPSPSGGGVGERGTASGAGFVGMITANSFMKREFGKKLIEEFLPRVDLTHFIDTSGAYIPGHGTPTVILFGRDRAPVGDTVRTVMGIKGEPETPADPARGLVWSAIVSQVDRPGSESDWVGVGDTSRQAFSVHPWSVGGGGSAELKSALENSSQNLLEYFVEEIGAIALTRADDAFVSFERALVRLRIPTANVCPFVAGENVRDWRINEPLAVVFPYDIKGRRSDINENAIRFLWPRKALLARRVAYGLSQIERGLKWYEYSMLFRERFTLPKFLVFSNVTTHNHFVLSEAGSVFNAHAPIIRLSTGIDRDVQFGLLGILNSSTACFWLQQVCHNKGRPGANIAGADERFEMRYEFDGTKLAKLPVSSEKPADLAEELDRLSRERQSHLPNQLADCFPLSRAELDNHHAASVRLMKRMISIQEELDWRCYRFYGVIDDEMTLEPAFFPEVDFGERAFEIVMARQIEASELETIWFERHRCKPITEIPAHWPEDYRRLVERRIALIERDRNVGLIERPKYKRRWNQEPWEVQEQRALRGWLLDRLETPAYWPDPELQTTRRLADRAGRDSGFMQVAELYRGHPDFDVHALVAELVESEAGPFLPVLRHKPTGLRKRAVWECTWDFQRREDAIDAAVEAELTRGEVKPDDKYRERVEKEQKRRKKQEIGDIPPPPKYRSADFLNTTFWRLRGALDVPKERFVSYPHCSKAADPSLVVAWAGWDHLQQAQALAAYYLNMKEQEGWTPERLTPLLAGLLELIPWVKQWHNDPDPNFSGARMGDYFESFVAEEARELLLTPQRLRAWSPPGAIANNRRRRVTK
jgi:hypothetical protein